MKNALKSFSVEQIEGAIAASIAALTGGDCKASISSLEFEGFTPNFPLPDIADLTIKITIKPAVSESAAGSAEPVPF